MSPLTVLACLLMSVAFLWLSVEMFTTYSDNVMGAIFVVAFLLGVGITISEALTSDDEDE